MFRVTIVNITMKLKRNRREGRELLDFMYLLILNL